jgi:hypothetical protein
MWWIEVWDKGKQYRQSTGLRGAKNERAAERILRAKVAELQGEIFRQETKSP